MPELYNFYPGMDHAESGQHLDPDHLKSLPTLLESRITALAMVKVDT